MFTRSTLEQKRGEENTVLISATLSPSGHTRSNKSRFKAFDPIWSSIWTADLLPQKELTLSLGYSVL